VGISDFIIGAAAVGIGGVIAYRNWEDRQATVAVAGMVKKIAPNDTQINQLADDRVMKKNIGIAVGAAIAVGGIALFASAFDD
jgi:hypothetical protein